MHCPANSIQSGILRGKWLCSLLLVLALLSAPINAADFAPTVQPFKLTEYSGYIAFRHFYDELDVSESGNSQQHQKNPTFQEELSMKASGYIFHPNFLSFDAGGSLLLDQSEFESEQGSNSSNEELVSVNLQLDFLEQKPYPFSIYYNRNNPSVSTGLSGRYIQENIRYGFDFALLDPITPVQITLKAFREQTEGEGFDQVIDENLEQVLLKLHYPYGSGQHAQLTLQQNDLDARSGNPNLSIIPRQSTTRSASLDTRNRFGADNKVQLTSNISARERFDEPYQKELNVSPKLSVQHTEFVNSYYHYNYSEYLLDYTENNITDIESTNDQLLAGVSRRTDTVVTGISLLAETSDSAEFDYKNNSVRIDASRIFAYDNSQVKLSYKLNLDNRDQQSIDNEFDIYGEQHTLEGTTPVDLLRANIISSTIVVSNITRTQTYNIGTDYLIIQVGDQTQLQRRVGGNILDGQVVLVDYSYQTGGTFAYDIQTHNLSVSWDWKKHSSLYARFRQSDQSLESGTVTGINLADLEARTYGLKTDRYLKNGLTVGGEYYTETVDNIDQQSVDISSYNKDNLTAYIELPLSNQTNIHLSGRRVKKDYLSSNEDNDITGMILRIRSRPGLRLSTSFESAYEKDTGGTLLREYQSHRILARWKMRQLSFNARITYTDEQQGTIRKNYWEAKAELRRDFF